MCVCVSEGYRCQAETRGESLMATSHKMGRIKIACLFIQSVRTSRSECRRAFTMVLLCSITRNNQDRHLQFILLASKQAYSFSFNTAVRVHRKRGEFVQMKELVDQWVTRVSDVFACMWTLYLKKKKNWGETQATPKSPSLMTHAKLKEQNVHVAPKAHTQTHSMETGTLTHFYTSTAPSAHTKHVQSMQRKTPFSGIVVY